MELEEGRVGSARIALSAGFKAAARQPASESRLVGHPLTDEAIDASVSALEFDAHSDWLASAEYRTHLARTLVGRCLHLARERLGGGS